MRGGGAAVRPLAIDLFCGLGGWAEGFLAEGYDVIGFDIERHDYGTGGYPGQLVLQDVLTLHGSQFRDAACIVASPPCQEYSYMGMPWSRAKQIVRALEGEGEFPEGYAGSRTIADLNALFNACFRIQREASEAAGHHIPLIVENVNKAQRWVGRAAWHYGSYYLWGDVPALMPMTLGRVLKQPGRNFHFPEKYGIPSPSFQGAEHEASVAAATALTGKPGRSFQSAAVAEKCGGDWFGRGENCSPMRMREEDYQKWLGGDGTKSAAVAVATEGRKGNGGWFSDYQQAKANGRGALNRYTSSHPHARKAASAMIAKIPFTLSNWIARCYKPEAERGMALEDAV